MDSIIPKARLARRSFKKDLFKTLKKTLYSKEKKLIDKKKTTAFN